jgi:ATP-binding cassette subfamily C protein
MPAQTYYPEGLKELKKVRNQGIPFFTTVAVFSVFVNLLMLTGPIYMLQVYDRVLGSRSEETLVALSILVLGLYGFMGVLDWARGRVMARQGANFQETLDARVFEATLEAESNPSMVGKPSSGLQDLEALQRLFGSPALLAVCDMPWTPIFAGAIFMFHPLLGAMALVGGLILIVLTFVNNAMTRTSLREGHSYGAAANGFAEMVRQRSELVQGMGMRSSVLNRWRVTRREALTAMIKANDRSGFFSAFTKAFRLGLQSAMLGVGAYLVLQGQLTPGAMIAGSILMGRALAPIEQAIGQWPIVDRGVQGWKGLSALLEIMPEPRERTTLPAPRAHLSAQGMTAVPPGDTQAALKMVTFEVKPGQAMGVIGPSAAGKSSLARMITGIWTPVAGKIRLDGATLDQYDPDVLGGYIGYLPQTVHLFNASIAENIARMTGQPDSAKVVEAAKRAGAHELILEQPDGYDTQIGADGGRLSGGQRQRIGLARALYGDPIILVLDEPNSNLDAIGSEALNSAIREMKSAHKSVIIMAHRPAAIAECDTLLHLDGGMVKAFGPRDEVLQASVKNVKQLTNSMKRQGAAPNTPNQRTQQPKSQNQRPTQQHTSASISMPATNIKQSTGKPAPKKPVVKSESVKKNVTSTSTVTTPKTKIAPKAKTKPKTKPKTDGKSS